MEIAHLRTAQHLLSVARTARHYEKAILQASGVSFNVFNILRIDRYEVKTHSPMLAELLNPKGSHGQGSIFLRHFCSAVGVTEFDTESASVTTERHIGPKTEISGGRIDIQISSKAGDRIIIENKIDASEETNQLGRYREYSQSAYLFFLTLSGEASREAGEANAPRAKPISYRSDIMRWLEACRKEAANAPTVRETITQYIQLIQQLTNQNTNTRMSQELTDAVLQNENSYLAYRALCATEQKVQETILAKLKLELHAAAGELGLKLNFPDLNLSNRYAGFWFTSPAMDEQAVCILFQFSQKNLGGCVFGFSRSAEGAICRVENDLFEAFRKSFPHAIKSPVWWIVQAAWEQHSHWGEKTMSSIQFGQFHAEVRQIVKTMLFAFTEATH
jgi:PD-(D/E)XK nuclease superfamily